jgi:hypothetical protein
VGANFRLRLKNPLTSPHSPKHRPRPGPSCGYDLVVCCPGPALTWGFGGFLGLCEKTFLLNSIPQGVAFTSRRPSFLLFYFYVLGFLFEPYLKAIVAFNIFQVIYEDLPSNLCAIRDYIEKTGDEDSNSTTHSAASTDPDVGIDYIEGRCTEQASASSLSSSTKQRPKVPGLQKDIEILRSELENFIAKYGQNGFMPKRKHLRSHGRVDIEKAITRMGGFRKIASIMNLSLSYKNRKPKGYWDNLENLQEEVIRNIFTFVSSFSAC